MKVRAGFVRELHGLLPLWVQQGWLEAAQAEQLRAQYPLPAHAPRQWWQVLLSILAALCVGGGVIALFAANWEELSRPVRVVLSVTPLFLSQAAFLYAQWRRPASVAWRESSALLIAISVGAAIALIAQTYHIESSGMFWRVWLWLVLPLPYVTRSWAAAFFVALLVHVFGVMEWGVFASAVPDHVGEYALYALALVSWLFWQAQRGAGYAGQSWVWRSLANAHALAFVLVLMMLHDFRLWEVMMLAGAVYVFCRAWCGVCVMGMAAALALALGYLGMSTSTMWYGAYDRLQLDTVLMGVSVTVLLLALPRWRQLRVWDVAFAAGGMALYGVFRLYAEMGWMQGWIWLATAMVLALGLMRLHMALHAGEMLAVNAALLWILAALYVRFVEDDMRLWVKGVAFIVAGCVLYALNVWAVRRRQGEKA